MGNIHFLPTILQSQDVNRQPLYLVLRQLVMEFLLKKIHQFIAENHS